MEGMVEALHRMERNIIAHFEHRFNHLENLITSKFNIMEGALVNLQAAVTKETSIEQSAIKLIQSLAADIKAAPDLATVQTLADQLNANADALAAAVTANTPAAPPAS